MKQGGILTVREQEISGAFVYFSLQMNMKKILPLLFFLPLFTKAQDTCQLKRETDPFTHQTRLLLDKAF